MKNGAWSKKEGEEEIEPNANVYTMAIKDETKNCSLGSAGDSVYMDGEKIASSKEWQLHNRTELLLISYRRSIDHYQGKCNELIARLEIYQCNTMINKGTDIFRQSDAFSREIKPLCNIKAFVVILPSVTSSPTQFRLGNPLPSRRGVTSPSSRRRDNCCETAA